MNNQFLMALKWTEMVETLRSANLRAMMHLIEAETDLDFNTVEAWHPLALAAKANSADNLTWDEAMNGPDRAGYWDAMEKELEMLTKHHDAWEVVDREPWMNVLPSTWAFKCKWFPLGLIRKLKARFCAHGDHQIEGIDYFDTFSPVVNWTTVHLLLIMSIILGLSTKQVDCTAAFLHALIDHDLNWENMMEEECAHSGIYVSMPHGFTQPGKVLKLKHSLYGLKQSPKNFFSLLKNKLESCGFSMSEDIDPCLFISDKVICLMYVDDLLFFSLQVQYIDEAIVQLSSKDLTLEVEDSVAGFLGVHIEWNEMDGSIKLTQLGLAQYIVEALDVSQLPWKDTPASMTPLVQDKDGDPLNGAYNYASVIGMLQYLQNQM